MGDYSNGRERRLKSVSVLVQIQNRLPTEVDNHDFYYAHLGRLLCAQLGLWRVKRFLPKIKTLFYGRVVNRQLHQTVNLAPSGIAGSAPASPTSIKLFLTCPLIVITV